MMLFHPLTITQTYNKTRRSNSNSIKIKMAIRAPNRVYEDFVPSTELVSEQGCDVFRVYLPGILFYIPRLVLLLARRLRRKGNHMIKVE